MRDSPILMGSAWKAVFCASLLILATGVPSLAQKQSNAPQSTWRVPDIATLPDDAASRQVRFGRDLLTHTSYLIGPDAQDASRRFSGNGLECASCHLDAGTQQYALPLVGVAAHYPVFSVRLGRKQTIEDRVNDCMQRSMNGHQLPLDGAEMTAFVAYLTFLSTGSSGSELVGRGVPSLPLPDRAANPAHGASIFASNCAVCHRSNGGGIRYSLADQAANRKRYLFPPVWGPDSYNDAAGMSHNITAAWFIHANMPKGITFQYPMLANGDAYDVAAYINQQSRPHFAPVDKDYPDRWLKPVDVAHPPVLGPFSLQQHALGPWQPIKDWLAKHTPPGPSLAPDDIEVNP